MKTSLLCLSLLSSCGDKDGVDTSPPSDPPVVVDVSCRELGSVDDWGIITIPVADVEARYPELGSCCDWAGEWTVELYSTPTKQYTAPLVIEAADDGAIMLVGDFSEYNDEITACDLAMWRTD